VVISSFQRSESERKMIRVRKALDQITQTNQRAKTMKRAIVTACQMPITVIASSPLIALIQRRRRTVRKTTVMTTKRRGRMRKERMRNRREGRKKRRRR
jgi:hypothetical protein